MRELRAQQDLSLKQMAEKIGASPAYFSALEHGHRGKPSWLMLQRIITCFNLIWDEAEELIALAGRSDPRVTIDTSGLSPTATQLTNLLASQISELSEDELLEIIEFLNSQKAG